MKNHKQQIAMDISGQMGISGLLNSLQIVPQPVPLTDTPWACHEPLDHGSRTAGCSVEVVGSLGRWVMAKYLSWGNEDQLIWTSFSFSRFFVTHLTCCGNLFTCEMDSAYF